MIKILNYTFPKKLESIDKTAAKLWKISNALLRLGLTLFILAILIALLIIISSGRIDPTEPSFMFNLFYTILPIIALSFIVLSAILMMGYNICVIVIAIILKDFLWAAGIFFIYPLSIIYKFIKGEELKK